MKTEKTKATDPVCGMTVDTDTAIHADRDGKTYYFCSESCRQKFLNSSTDGKPTKKSGGCCGGD